MLGCGYEPDVMVPELGEYGLELAGDLVLPAKQCVAYAGDYKVDTSWPVDGGLTSRGYVAFSVGAASLASAE